MASNHAQKSLLISFALYSAIALSFARVFGVTKEPIQKITSITLSSFQEKEEEKPQNNQLPKTQPKQAVHKKIYPAEKRLERQIDTNMKNNTLKEESIVKNESVENHTKQPAKEPINTEKEYLKINKVRIREAIAKHQKYPVSAIKMDHEGTCTVRFKLHPSGSVDGIKVVESSGFAAIDKSAIQAVNDAASEMPRPNEGVTLTIPIGYTLH